MKHLTLLLFLIPLSVSAQDKIKDTDGNVLDVKIIEVNDDNIKYKMSSYLDGPTHTMAKSKISEIVYANGTTDKFNPLNSVRSEAYRKLEKENISEIFKKGNKVYVTKELEVPADAVEFVKDNLKEWGYWTVVDTPEEADFQIRYFFKELGMARRSASISLLTRNNIEFKSSKKYTEGPAIWNGYSGSRGVASAVVEKFLKKEFK